MWGGGCAAAVGWGGGLISGSNLAGGVGRKNTRDITDMDMWKFGFVDDESAARVHRMRSGG
jgi:hypothetical protein